MSEDSMIARAVVAGVEDDRKSRDVWAEVVGDARATGTGFLLRHNPDGTRTRVDPADVVVTKEPPTPTRQQIAADMGGASKEMPHKASSTVFLDAKLSDGSPRFIKRPDGTIFDLYGKTSAGILEDFAEMELRIKAEFFEKNVLTPRGKALAALRQRDEAQAEAEPLAELRPSTASALNEPLHWIETGCGRTVGGWDKHHELWTLLGEAASITTAELAARGYLYLEPAIFGGESDQAIQEIVSERDGYWGDRRDGVVPDDKPHAIRNIWRRPGSTWAGVGLIVMAIGIVGENNGLPLTWWDACVFGGACFAAVMGGLGR